MKIGLSLPYAYLSNNISKTDNIFNTTLGTEQKALSYFSSLIDYIEISNFSTQTPPDHIVSAVRNIWKHGLKVSLHPSLPQDVEGKSLEEIYPWLSPLMPDINKYQKSLMLNLHALASPTGELNQLKKDSIANLITLTDLITAEKHPLSVAVELNRSKGVIDPCTTYEGVLDICKQVNSPLLGIGWDFGHTFANYQNNLISQVPPKAFLEKITHTHIHDISPDGKTHWPLTMGVIPLNDYIRLLEENDYTGIFILELQPTRFAKHGNIKELFLESINILKAVIQKVNKLQNLKT